MSQVETILSAQISSMLEMLERSRDERCADVAARAQGEVAEVLARARRESRARVADAVRARRRDNAAQVRAARAEIETEARTMRLVRAQRVLEEGWSLVRAALAERWRDPTARRAWIASVLEVAASRLPSGGWRVIHPPNLDAAERVEPGRERATEHAIRWEPGDIEAGLRVHRGGAIVDGTPEGLLVQRSAIGARLLALYHREREAPS